MVTGESKWGGGGGKEGSQIGLEAGYEIKAGCIYDGIGGVKSVVVGSGAYAVVVSG